MASRLGDENLTILHIALHHVGCDKEEKPVDIPIHHHTHGNNPNPPPSTPNT